MELINYFSDANEAVLTTSFVLNKTDQITRRDPNTGDIANSVTYDKEVCEYIPTPHMSGGKRTRPAPEDELPKRRNISNE